MSTSTMCTSPLVSYDRSWRFWAIVACGLACIDGAVYVLHYTAPPFYVLVAFVPLVACLLATATKGGKKKWTSLLLLSSNINIAYGFLAMDMTVASLVIEKDRLDGVICGCLGFLRLFACLASLYLCLGGDKTVTLDSEGDASTHVHDDPRRNAQRECDGKNNDLATDDQPFVATDDVCEKEFLIASSLSVVNRDDNYNIETSDSALRSGQGFRSDDVDRIPLDLPVTLNAIAAIFCGVASSRAASIATAGVGALAILVLLGKWTRLRWLLLPAATTQCVCFGSVMTIAVHLFGVNFDWLAAAVACDALLWLATAVATSRLWAYLQQT